MAVIYEPGSAGGPGSSPPTSLKRIPKSADDPRDGPSAHGARKGGAVLANIGEVGDSSEAGPLSASSALGQEVTMKNTLGKLAGVCVAAIAVSACGSSQGESFRVTVPAASAAKIQTFLSSSANSGKFPSLADLVVRATCESGNSYTPPDPAIQRTSSSIVLLVSLTPTQESRANAALRSNNCDETIQQDYEHAARVANVAAFISDWVPATGGHP